MAEFYAIVTDARRVAAPRSSSEALDAIAAYLAMPCMTLLPTPIDVVARWMDLLRRQPVIRGKVYDLQLIAMMLGNGVSRIYTFNRPDFAKFEEVTVLAP